MGRGWPLSLGPWKNRGGFIFLFEAQKPVINILLVLFLTSQPRRRQGKLLTFGNWSIMRSWKDWRLWQELFLVHLVVFLILEGLSIKPLALFKALLVEKGALVDPWLCADNFCAIVVPFLAFEHEIVTLDSWGNASPFLRIIYLVLGLSVELRLVGALRQPLPFLGLWGHYWQPLHLLWVDLPREVGIVDWRDHVVLF